MDDDRDERRVVTGEVSDRYGLLDAWRGLACLFVVMHHAGYALSRSEASGSWGRWLSWLAVRRLDVGVTLFFVISGYCIAASLEATRRRGQSPWAFFARRFWRIYPPYWAALFGFAVVVSALEVVGLERLFRGPLGVKLDPVADLDWRQWLGNLTLTETWRPHVWGPGRNLFTGVAWSLCFEEQFYLIGLLALCLAPRRMALTLGIVTAAVVAVRGLAWWGGRLDDFRGTFPALWHEFAVGIAVYYGLHKARGPWQRHLVVLALAGMFVVGLLTGGLYTASAAGFGLALLGLWRWDAAAEGLRWLLPLRACGRRCYSIYLAHLPVCVVGNHWLFELGLTGFWAKALVMVPLVTVAGVAAGWAFHAAVERHFLRPPTFSARRFLASARPRLPAARGAAVGS
jgi:peptidoglycan/LPS O-acetylase OafA/YrhL